MSDYDALDVEGQVAASDDRSKRALLARENEGADIKWLMGSVRGRRVMRRLLDRACVPTGDPFNTNALMMARQVGMQEVGRQYLVLIEAHCPELLPVMTREARVASVEGEEDGRDAGSRNIPN